MHDLRLKASESNWRLFMVRKADAAFRAFETKIFTRDHYTCQFCGFCAQQFQEVMNLDGNYANNRVVNLATACAFCIQCNFLEALGKSDFGGGTLICLPEMSQTELNALCHGLFASMLGVGTQANAAKNFYRSLRLRAQLVEEQLGEGMSNPALLGQVLIDVDISEAEILQQKLDVNIRLLPSITKFSPLLMGWAQDAIQAMNYDD